MTELIFLKINKLTSQMLTNETAPKHQSIKQPEDIYIHPISLILWCSS